MRACVLLVSARARTHGPRTCQVAVAGVRDRHHSNSTKYCLFTVAVYDSQLVPSFHFYHAVQHQTVQEEAERMAELRLCEASLILSMALSQATNRLTDCMALVVKSLLLFL
jgi:hypothetical protein